MSAAPPPGAAANRELLLQIRNHPSETRGTLEQVNAFGETCGWSKALQNELQLILEEWLANIISYAFPPGATGSVRLRLKQSGDVVQAEVADTGQPFNPLKTPPPDLSLPPEQRPIGGLGIHMIKNLVDEISYERCGRENILRFSKSLQHPKLRQT